MALRFLPDPGILGAIGEDRAARLLDERARLLAERGAAAPAPAAPPVLLVAVGAETFGIPLDRVAEILPAEPPCPLPRTLAPGTAGASPAVLGLRARAGRLHTVIDLALLLGLEGGVGPGGHDVLLRPGPGTSSGAASGRRLALRVGRALAASSPLPLPPERAPVSPGGAVAFHAMQPGTELLLGVLDLDRLLRPLAADSFPSTPLPPAAGA